MIDQARELYLKRKKTLRHPQTKTDKIIAQGKFTVEERVSLLLDEADIPLEIGGFAGYELYPKYDQCISGGVKVAIGKVSGMTSVIVANDPCVKAGALFPISVRKIIRAQEISLKSNLPIIYLVDCSGVFLPLQEEIFPDKEGFGKIFYNNSIISSNKIPQIAVILGHCIAGGAYLPMLCDETVICSHHGTISIAGPNLVKASIGEISTIDELGGYQLQCLTTGAIDNQYESEKECIDHVRKSWEHLSKAFIDKNSCQELTSKLFTNNENMATSQSSDEKEYLEYKDQPTKNHKNLLLKKDLSNNRDRKNDNQNLINWITQNSQKFDQGYESLELIRTLIDDGDFIEYKKDHGKTIICGYGRIDNISLGIIANQRKIQKTSGGEFQIGGVIYDDSAKKASGFIMNCNQRNIPILFIHDVSGFIVGKRSESKSTLKEGAKMINLLSNSHVPKISLIIGNSYGAGHYAMGGTAFNQDFIFAWPNANIGVMGFESMKKTLSEINTSPEEIESYKKKTSSYYAASRLWIDEIIDPYETRSILSLALKSFQSNSLYILNS